MDRGSPRRRLGLALLIAGVAVAAAGSATAAGAEKFFVYNLTAATDLAGVFLAPTGTTDWGPNQALNDKDHQVEPTERLLVRGIRHGIYDVRAVAASGHACIKKGVDLTSETTFDIRDADMDCP